MNDLGQRTPAHVSLAGSRSVGEMATREEWDPDTYAVVLASHIRNSGVGLSVQTERLAALAGIGDELSLLADQSAAAALAQHYAILEALHQRFASEAFKALNAGELKASEVADRYLVASVRAQRAAMAVLSALKVLRDSAALGPAPTTTTTGGTAYTPLVDEVKSTAVWSRLKY